MKSIIDNIEIPDSIKAKLQSLGLKDEDINNEAAVIVSLYQQAIKGNVSAAKYIQELVSTPDKSQQKEDQEIKKDITKDVQKEEKRLLKIISNLSKEQIDANKDYIHNLAFMSVTLKNLSDDKAKNGVKEQYKNVANQWGYKDRTEVKTYNNMFKNYQAAMKQFNELLIMNNISVSDEFDSFGDEE